MGCASSGKGLLIGCSVADLATTEIALQTGDFGEMNPLGQTMETRIALKTMGVMMLLDDRVSPLTRKVVGYASCFLAGRNAYLQYQHDR